MGEAYLWKKLTTPKDTIMENDRKRMYGPEGSNPEENSEQNLESRMKRELSASNPNDEFIDTDPNRNNANEDRDAGQGDTSTSIGGNERRDFDERNYNDKDPNSGDVGTSINSGP